MRGAYNHAAAVCRAGEREAERGVFRLSADRAGFAELDRWLERQGSVERVVMESSGHYCWPLASHLHRSGYVVAVVNPLQSHCLGRFGHRGHAVTTPAGSSPKGPAERFIAGVAVR